MGMVNSLTEAQRYRRSIELGIIVDPEDEWLLSVMTWRLSTKGYVETTHYDGDWYKTTKFHHYITGTPIWNGDQIDHVDRNKLNNRRSNLRWTDNAGNQLNTERLDEALGVYPNKGCYEVHLNRGGVRHWAGTFKTIEEAIGARDELKSQLQGSNT
jgi:hypothetical protein